MNKKAKYNVYGVLAAIRSSCEQFLVLKKIGNVFLAVSQQGGTPSPTSREKIKRIGFIDNDIYVGNEFEAPKQSLQFSELRQLT